MLYHHSEEFKRRLSQLPLASPEKAAEHDDDHERNAEAETDEALDVEEYVSASSQSLLPPSELKTVKPRRNRKRQARDTHTAQKKAQKKGGGSRLVLNDLDQEKCGPNKRSCLLDSVVAILPTNINSNLVHAAISSSMPMNGDTTIGDIKDALAEYSLMLEQVNKNFIRKGGAAYYLLQERECRLIISIRLTNLEGVAMSHFVAWDGEIIFDKPYTRAK